MGFMDELWGDEPPSPEPEDFVEEKKPNKLMKGVKAQFKNENIYIVVKPQGKQYYYRLVVDDDVVSYQLHNNAPDECSRQTNFVNDFANKIVNVTHLQKDHVQDTVMIMLNSLAGDVVEYVKNKSKMEEAELQEKNRERLLELEPIKDEFLEVCVSSGVTPIDVLQVLITYKANGENKNILTGILCHYSTYFKRYPLWFMAVGGAGEGKSFIEEASISFVPKSAVMDGRISSSALHRLSLDYSASVLDGKVMRMGDLGGKKDFEKYGEVMNDYKQLSTEGKIEKTITSESINKETGEKGTLHMYLEGQCSVTFTTVHSETIDDQFSSRGFIIEPISTDDEVQRYALFKDGDYKVEVESVETEWINRLIWGYVEYIHLKHGDTRVYNPYLDCLFDWLKKHPDYFKRGLNQYKALVETVTLLNYKWRKPQVVDGVTYITSTVHDNQLVAKLFQPTYGLSPVTIKLMNQCINWFFKQSKVDKSDVVVTPVICDCTPEEYLRFTEKELDDYEAGNLKVRDFVGVFTASTITHRLGKSKLKISELGEALNNLKKQGFIEDTGVRVGRTNKIVYRLSYFTPFSEELLPFDDEIIEHYVTKIAPRTFKKIPLQEFSKEDGQEFVMDYEKLKNISVGDLGVSEWF